VTKKVSKCWWIVREDGEVILKLLSWNQVKKITPVKKFHWPEESPGGGHSYLSYLKEKGLLS
jgi:hypothetical protein